MSSIRASKTTAALAFIVALGAGPTAAFAQGTMVPEVDRQQQQQPAAQPATTTAQPSPAPQQTAQTAQPAQPATSAQPAQPASTAQPAQTTTPAQGTTTETAPEQQAPVVAPPPVPVVPAQGQWVYTDQYGWIWVPEGSTTVYVREQPYVYLYTPTYGWTWYGSPWGPGRYYYGPWVHHVWGAPRVWHRGGWYAPHVVVGPRIGGPARVYRGGGYGRAGAGHHGGHR